MPERGTPSPALLHVVWSLGIAGAEKLAYDIAVGMAGSHFRPIVCSIEHDGPLHDQLKAEGIPVYVRRPTRSLDLDLIKWLRNLIISENITVVHAHQYNPFFYSALALIGIRNVNLVYTEHGRIYPEVRNWKRMLINPLLALRVNHIVSISEKTKLAMATYDRLPERRIKVIHNGVDSRKFQSGADLAKKRLELGISKGACVIGTAARLEPVKNLPMMLRMFAIVVRDIPTCVLVIAGEGSEETRLRALAAELGIERGLRFIGLRSDLPDILPLLDVFLLSSHTEGISVTLLEAMASGVPAVVTDVGGNPEVVVEGETGFLVPPEDVGVMADRVMKILSNRALSERMSRTSVERVTTEFSFSRMFMKYREIYDMPPSCCG